jgi:hypothetical protein
MTLSKTDICNYALTALGQPAVTDVDTDTTAGGIQAKRHYDPTLNSLLRSHPWQFASMWADLVRPTIVTSGTSTGTNSATTLNDTGQAWTVNVYAGCWLWVTDGTGEGQIRLIASNTATCLTTADDFTVTPDATSVYEVWQFSLPFQDAPVTSGTSTGTNSSTTLNDTGKSWTVNAYAPTDDATYWLWITSGTGSNQIRRIVSNTATQITTDDDFKVTPTTAGYEVWKYPTSYRWDYQYVLPSDFLRLLQIDPELDADVDVSNERYAIQGDYLKSDSETMRIQYVRTVTDPTEFDALFVEAMTTALAAKLVMPLLQDKVWQVELEKKLDRILQRARAVNFTEARAQKKPLTWNEARGASTDVSEVTT